MKITQVALWISVFVLLTSCAAKKPPSFSPKNTASNWVEEAQIEIGRPNLIVDSLGNIFGIPSKILLLNSKVENHNLSPETIQSVEKYIEENPRDMGETKVRINQFAPIGEFGRLIKNKKVEWWWRIFPGIPTTLISSFGRLIGGDHYNPYTDTINLYSDVSSIAIHEVGHAVDFNEQAKDGTAGLYAVGRLLTPVTLYQEYAASEHAIEHMEKEENYGNEKQAYKTLYPAYGTYVGGSMGVPYANAMGAGVGHVLAITPVKNRQKTYKAFKSVEWSEQIVEEDNLSAQ